MSGTDWVKNGDRWTVTGVRDGALTVRHRDSGLTHLLPAEYVAAHVELGYASTVHTAQGLTADVMHGIVTGEETRQLLYTMLTRGRAENHVHVITRRPGDDARARAARRSPSSSPPPRSSKRILARDGAAVSATSTRERAATPETRLHDAATRYADAVALATQQRARHLADDEPSSPARSRGCPASPPRWPTTRAGGPYLAARATPGAAPSPPRSATEQTQTLPAWLDDYDDVLTPDLRAEIAVWRAAHGIPPDERTIAGPAPDDDRAATYRRSLIRTVNSRYDDAVHVWERRVVAYVGRADEHTLTWLATSTGSSVKGEIQSPC